MKDTFIKAIHEKRKLKVTFFSKEDNHSLTRTCVPLDFAPSRRALEKTISTISGITTVIKHNIP